jgi:cysteine synthase A
MDVRNGLLGSIGNTPLIRLNKLSEQTGCEILGKAEFMNPGGSVKDRAAKYMILDGEKRGVIEKGGIVIEGTAGNTGIGLTLVGNARGYKTIICMPSSQSQEKKDFLRASGAEVIEIPPVPYANPNQYVHVTSRLADELAKDAQHGVLYANQWDNTANREGHIASTGPEVWTQTDGRVDGFICAIGTGGTLAGMSMYLKEEAKLHKRDVKIGIADPMGAKMFKWFTEGKLESEGSSISEGIGQGRVTGNLEGAEVDMPFQIPDSEAIPLLWDVIESEGLMLGSSSAINLAGAVRMAKELGPGKTIVTILADSGSRYQSKLFNPEFLRSKDLPVPAWLEEKARSVEHLFVDPE